MMLSDVCLSVCLTSVYHVHQAPPKLRTERPRKTKIGTEVAHVTRDSDTTFKVKSQRSGSPGHFTQRCVNASASCSGDRGNVLTVGTYTATLRSTGAVGSAARGASVPTEGGEWRGHIVAAAHLQLVSIRTQYKMVAVTVLLRMLSGCY